MDSYENEASKFAAQRTKLKNICEAHDLTARTATSPRMPTSCSP